MKGPTLALAIALSIFISPRLPAQGPPTSAEQGRLAALLGLVPGRVVGEIGAGQGQLAIYSASVVGPAGRVYATELGSVKRDLLRDKVEASGATNIAVVEAQVASTGLPRGCCDAIYMRDVYHHLSEPMSILSDLKAALRPGGRVLIIDFEPRGSTVPVEGVPADRRGHGVPMKVVVEELKAAGFEVKSEDPAWPAESLFAVLASR